MAPKTDLFQDGQLTVYIDYDKKKGLNDRLTYDCSTVNMDSHLYLQRFNILLVND